MFATVSTLQPGVEEDRMHKLEILTHCQWEKLRSLDAKFAHVQHEVHQIKKDVGFMKDSFTDIHKKLDGIMALTQKNADEAAKKAEEEKEAVPESKEEDDSILSRVVEAQESLVAKFDSLEKIENIEKVAKLSYEWIRQVYIDVRKIKDDASNTLISDGAAEPVITIKRSLSSCEEHPPQPPPKRLRRNEQAALDCLQNVISDNEIEKMVHGNMLDHIEGLLTVYSIRADDIRGWMQQTRKPISKPCCLCGNTEHHGYECTTITDVDERKSILKEKQHCMECSNWHRGKCTINLDCRICSRARSSNQMVMGGVAHCRMFCPLQEEYHAAMRICKALVDAKHLLKH